MRLTFGIYIVNVLLSYWNISSRCRIFTLFLEKLVTRIALKNVCILEGIGLIWLFPSGNMRTQKRLFITSVPLLIMNGT